MARSKQKKNQVAAVAEGIEARDMLALADVSDIPDGVPEEHRACLVVRVTGRRKLDGTYVVPVLRVESSSAVVTGMVYLAEGGALRKIGRLPHRIEARVNAFAASAVPLYEPRPFAASGLASMTV